MIKTNETLNHLLTRRSVKVTTLATPGPTADEIQTLLTAATRVPDHGKLCPWYFLVFENEKRLQAGDIIAKAYKTDHPTATPGKIDTERQRLARAPLVIAVISRARKGKPPLWEQILSSGAVCMNLAHAAHALGYGAQWLTEWYAYHDAVKSGLGLDHRDHIAGFIHIGTPTTKPEERDRPDLNEIVTRWAPNVTLNKGDIYNYEKFDIPELGFKPPTA